MQRLSKNSKKRLKMLLHLLISGGVVLFIYFSLSDEKAIGEQLVHLLNDFDFVELSILFFVICLMILN